MPRREHLLWGREEFLDADCGYDVPLTATRRAQMHNENDYFPLTDVRDGGCRPKASMQTPQEMDPLVVKVARRYRAGTDALKRPGVHDYDLSAGGIGFTLTLVVPDPDTAQRWDPIQAEVAVDRGIFPGREDLLDYEDSMLTSVSKFLGRRVRWREGEWGRGRDNTWTRGLGLPKFGG